MSQYQTGELVNFTLHRQSPAAEEKYSPVHRLERRERDTQGEIHVVMETHILLSTDCVPKSTSDIYWMVNGRVIVIILTQAHC